MYYESVIKKHDMYFQKFLARNIDRSKMFSMIYEVSKNANKGIGYV